ncbi:MAG: hypothetical protein KKG14_09960 [Alphaproteobacteria bacterium]|nr:hypothetical protein [Alphaproteobacteria bacterium]MBU2269706.1 hypothetical protein [Alphaproteobacteria bacterium]MBU2419012.1 hypothetical protein [Alphaproteobacteria bacterium]
MRTRRPLVAAALMAGMAIATAAAAQTPGQTRAPAPEQSSARAVLICDSDDASRRAFAREYGATPVFITAREAVGVRPSEPAWSAPRCMTEVEHAKLRDASRQQSRAPVTPQS